jgi:hypothetical protein
LESSRCRVLTKEIEATQIDPLPPENAKPLKEAATEEDKCCTIQKRPEREEYSDQDRVSHPRLSEANAVEHETEGHDNEKCLSNRAVKPWA